jgi:THO complex subunit 4
MAEAKIDKSLDDIIKEGRKTSFRGGRGGGNNRGMRGGAGGGRFRGSANGRQRQNGASNGGIQKRRSAGANTSLSPNKAAASINGQWNHDLYQNGRRSASNALAAQSSGGPAKVVISNLDFGVNDSDIEGLFQEFGKIRKAAVHYDRSGRSLGTADVLFERKQDAIRALTHYNGVSLDGRPMNIQLTASLSAPRIMPTRVGGGGGGGSPGGQRRGGSGGGPRRGGQQRGGRGGRGGGGAPKPQKSAADLDADLDAYSAKMQTD